MATLQSLAVVKGIVNVGVSVGVVIVVTMLALGGGAASLVTREEGEG